MTLSTFQVKYLWQRNARSGGHQKSFPNNCPLLVPEANHLQAKVAWRRTVFAQVREVLYVTLDVEDTLIFNELRA